VAAFVAVPGQGSGVAVSGAVGAQMRVQGKGAPAASQRCLALAAPPKAKAIALAAAHTSSWTPGAIGAGLAAVIAVLLVVILRQRRRIRASTPSPNL
jgi:hypothetical protein